jgi:hypothetical protein
MRPKQQEATGSGDLFRARLEQIINMKHELVQLAGSIDWAWLDGSNRRQSKPSRRAPDSDSPAGFTIAASRNPR